jgi:glycosyltransferase involved in cell wall biosynthesis
VCNHVREILQAAKDTGETLVAVGDYSTRYGKKLFQEFQCPNIIFPGTLYDKNVVNALRTECVFYLHGHSAGGTNPALLEAMGCGAMVLAHKNAFNDSVLGGLGALWQDEKELTELLVQRPSAEVRAQQRALSQERIAQHFNWEGIASAYLGAMAEL